MNEMTHPYAMGFHEAREHGIDYRDYKKVDCLPDGIELIAVAGVWGNSCNIRCLFVDAEGGRYMRAIRGGQGNYPIRELGVNAKEIRTGQRFRL